MFQSTPASGRVKLSKTVDTGEPSRLQPFQCFHQGQISPHRHLCDCRHPPMEHPPSRRAIPEGDGEVRRPPTPPIVIIIVLVWPSSSSSSSHQHRLPSSRDSHKQSLNKTYGGGSKATKAAAKTRQRLRRRLGERGGGRRWSRLGEEGRGAGGEQCGVESAFCVLPT